MSFIVTLFACSIPLLLWGYFVSFFVSWFQKKAFFLWLFIWSAIAWFLFFFWKFLENVYLLAILIIVISLLVSCLLGYKRKNILLWIIIFIVCFFSLWLFVFLQNDYFSSTASWTIISLGFIIVTYWLKAFIEEYAKAIWLLSQDIYKLQDIFLYSICIALGFAFFENCLYLLFQEDKALWTYAFRSIFSSSVHIFSTCILWYFVLFNRNKISFFRILFFVICGFWLSTLIHTSFNVFLHYNILVFSPLYAIATYFLISYFYYSNNHEKN